MSGKQGVFHPHPNASTADEILVQYQASFNGTEIARTPEHGASVRLGQGTSFQKYSVWCLYSKYTRALTFENLWQGLLPPGIERCVEQHLGVNGSATVKMWGEWATNSTFLQRHVPDTARRARMHAALHSVEKGAPNGEFFWRGGGAAGGAVGASGEGGGGGRAERDWGGRGSIGNEKSMDFRADVAASGGEGEGEGGEEGEGGGEGHNHPSLTFRLTLLDWSRYVALQADVSKVVHLAHPPFF
jgi:hypothetical protein